MKNKFTACSVSFLWKLSVCRGCCMEKKKKKGSQQPALREAGWNFSSAAKNDKVEGWMLLQ